MRYLLDTNIVSALVRDPHHQKMNEQIQIIGQTEVCTSIIVAAELRFGAARRGSSRLTDRVNGILARLEVLPFEAPADAVYAELRTRLERAGTPISANDLLIAAQCLALGYTVVTDNEREFSRIHELPIENWLRR
jgi:tRNA(fMet)-specific endonuclease VapC